MKEPFELLNVVDKMEDAEKQRDGDDEGNEHRKDQMKAQGDQKALLGFIYHY